MENSATEEAFHFFDFFLPPLIFSSVWAALPEQQGLGGLPVWSVGV